MSENVYGIDLGTTYSALARINDLGMAEIVKNFEGNDVTPSAIFFEGGDNVVVGSEAKNAAASDPENSVTLIKREMGTDFKVDYQGSEWTPESLSSLILKELVTAANNETGEEVRKVVITVPAYFGTQEREATRQAGVIAGLEVEAIVAEPVAAALSLGLSDGNEETILVYDLGGGTFDTTVMKITSGRVEVVNTDGSRTLGGADWDNALLELVIDKFAQEAGIDGDDAKMDSDFMTDLSLRVEDLKKNLTRRNEAKTLCNWEGSKANVTITRAEFEAASKHLLRQTIDISKRTMEEAQKKYPDLAVDRVLLVGGSARMPQVAQALKDELGWDAQETDFDLAVAKGAAIYGKASVEEVLYSEGDEAPDTAGGEAKRFLGGASTLEVTNVLARGVGIQFVRAENGEPYIGFFASANDAIPMTDTIQASTNSEGQTSVSIELYEQAGEVESENVEDNRLLKSVDLPFKKPMPRGSEINIDCAITSEGLIRIKATDPKTGDSVDLEATVSVLSEEEVAAATSQVAGITLRS
ncbi:Hsp70 family protein [Brevibacterium ravenspurgense]|uniref:Hsp70 family protein n=1 Tax=Brevibacterium ravenspurgense TaxID=479117 RepID=UPI001EF336C1|nr:Hsp70 family protein [Brevibacterium ravenspurgense]MCG7301631.1 Hsp70 family protein [Brevibacterium ravenspurgense]